MSFTCCLDHLDSDTKWRHFLLCSVRQVLRQHLPPLNLCNFDLATKGKETKSSWRLKMFVCEAEASGDLWADSSVPPFQGSLTAQNTLKLNRRCGQGGERKLGRVNLPSCDYILRKWKELSPAQRNEAHGKRQRAFCYFCSSGIGHTHTLQ